MREEKYNLWKPRKLRAAFLGYRTCWPNPRGGKGAGGGGGGEGGRGGGRGGRGVFWQKENWFQDGKLNFLSGGKCIHRIYIIYQLLDHPLSSVAWDGRWLARKFKTGTNYYVLYCNLLTTYCTNTCWNKGAYAHWKWKKIIIYYIYY